MAMPGMGSVAPGFSPQDLAYHQAHAGQPFVYSGYWGRPVYASELPDYEKVAYGFPTSPPVGSGGGGQWIYDSQTKTWHSTAGLPPVYDPTGKNNPGSAMGFGGYGASGSYGGSMSYSMQGPMGDPFAYQRAATNAIQAAYNRMREVAANVINTEEARAGRFGGGVRTEKQAARAHELSLAEAADIARLWQSRYDQLMSMSQKFGGGPTGFGPWNMGGFGSALPGFNPMPGSPPVTGPKSDPYVMGQWVNPPPPKPPKPPQGVPPPM